MTNKERIITAIKLIEESQNSTDKDHHACDKCKSTVYNNWSEAITSKILGGILTKLRGMLLNENLQLWLEK